MNISICSFPLDTYSCTEVLILIFNSFFFLIYIYIFYFYFYFFITVNFLCILLHLHYPLSVFFLHFSTRYVFCLFRPRHIKAKNPTGENLLGNKPVLIVIQRLVKICASFITDFGRQHWWIIQVHNILCWRQRTFYSHGLNCFKPVQLINKNNIKSLNQSTKQNLTLTPLMKLEDCNIHQLRFFLSLLPPSAFYLFHPSSFSSLLITFIFSPLFCLHCSFLTVHLSTCHLSSC